ncbi:MAG: nucleotide exchange factor GrpE [Thermoplasmata archaeon]
MEETTPPPSAGPAAEAPPASAPPSSGPPAEAEDWATRYRYLLAEFDNYRKRSERDRAAAIERARADLLREILPLYEAIGHARAAIPAEAASLHRGLDLVEAEWQRFLQREGVAPVARVGAPFAPEEQEAVAEAPPRDGIPVGSVAEVVQQGYRSAAGLLRPAKVVVARAPPEAAAAPAPEEREAGSP